MSWNQLFFNFFNTSVSDFVSNRNWNCSKLSFEAYNVSVAQKLKSLGFFISLFSSGPWPLQWPPDALILTSATSVGNQILAEDISFYMKHCLLVWSKNWESSFYIFLHWTVSKRKTAARRKYGANINLRHRSCLLLKITVGIHAITFVVMVGMTIITCRLFCYLKSKDFVVKGLECCTG